MFHRCSQLGDSGGLNVAGLRDPILGFRFPNGGMLGVEFTEHALDEQHTRRAAWLELIADDPLALQERVLQARLRQVHYIASGRPVNPNIFYFTIPGGQGFGIVPAAGTAAAELQDKLVNER